jgi:hypothetical protein
MMRTASAIWDRPDSQIVEPRAGFVSALRYSFSLVTLTQFTEKMLYQPEINCACKGRVWFGYFHLGAPPKMRQAVISPNTSPSTRAS